MTDFSTSWLTESATQFPSLKRLGELATLKTNCPIGAIMIVDSLLKDQKPSLNSNAYSESADTYLPGRYAMLLEERSTEQRSTDGTPGLGSRLLGSAAADRSSLRGNQSKLKHCASQGSSPSQSSRAADELHYAQVLASRMLKSVAEHASDDDRGFDGSTLSEKTCKATAVGADLRLDLMREAGLQRTFSNVDLEKDFLSYCQLACPVAMSDETLVLKRQELLSCAAEYVELPEFSREDAEQHICGETLLEPIGETFEDFEFAPDDTCLYTSLCCSRLLRPAEERSVFRRMHYYRYLAHRLLAGQGIDQWTIARAEGLVRAANWHRAVVIQSNMRLVVSIIKRLPAGRENYDDLVSDGIIGLLRALDKFDPGRGFRFCTYATPVIRRECLQQLYLRQEDREHYAGSAVLAILPVLEEDLEDSVHQATLSLRRSQLNEMISTLSRREQVVLRARFCLGVHREVKTLQRLADALKISKERVRQIEISAIEKLKRMAQRLESVTNEETEPVASPLPL